MRVNVIIVKRTHLHIGTSNSNSKVKHRKCVSENHLAMTSSAKSRQGVSKKTTGFIKRRRNFTLNVGPSRVTRNAGKSVQNGEKSKGWRDLQPPCGLSLRCHPIEPNSAALGCYSGCLCVPSLVPARSITSSERSITGPLFFKNYFKEKIYRDIVVMVLSLILLLTIKVVRTTSGVPVLLPQYAQSIIVLKCFITGASTLPRLKWISVAAIRLPPVRKQPWHR